MSTRFLCVLLLLLTSTSLFSQQCQSVNFTPGQAIPDNDVNGLTVTLPINMPGTLGSDYILDSVRVNIGHTWIGDIFAKLINPEGDTITLFDRPGVPEPPTGNGCANDDVSATFSTTSNLLAEALCYAGPALAGNIKPINPLIQSGSISGNWKLFAADLASADIGSINSVTFYFTPLWYNDLDGDGYGGGVPAKACSAPANRISQHGDCNDNSASVHPNAIEICGNKIDEDCSGIDADYLYQPTLFSNAANGFCEGDSVLLVINPFANGDSLFWQYNQDTLSTSSGNALYASAGGIYTATVIMTNGCYYPLNNVTITEYPSPNPVITQTVNGLSTGNYASYIWRWNTVIIPTANDANYLPQNDGSYTVEVVDSNGCLGGSAPFNVMNASISENGISSFTMYPNPANEFIYADLNITENITLDMLDLQGKSVYTTTINSNHFLVDLKEFKSGIYFVRVGNKSNKLIILH